MKLSPIFWAFNFLLIFPPLALALEPSAINENDKVRWSEVVNSPVDGIIVYDKDFNPHSVLVSTWSPKEIRATFIQRNDIVVGTREVERCHHSRDDYWCDMVTEEIRSDRVIIPKELRFFIHGKIYTYIGGLVPVDLSQALASAPPGDMFIQALWPDGKTYNMRVGPKTVAAWKVVFRECQCPLSKSVGNSRQKDYEPAFRKKR